MLDLIPDRQPINNQFQILWCGYQHVITSRPITALVFLRCPACFCLGVHALARTKRDGKYAPLWSGGLSGSIHTKDARIFSAAEILLRMYQNPIHLNGTRWRTTFFRRRTSRCLQNLIRQQVPFKCVGF